MARTKQTNRNQTAQQRTKRRIQVITLGRQQQLEHEENRLLQIDGINASPTLERTRSEGGLKARIERLVGKGVSTKEHVLKRVEEAKKDYASASAAVKKQCKKSYGKLLQLYPTSPDGEGNQQRQEISRQDLVIEDGEQPASPNQFPELSNRQVVAQMLQNLTKRVGGTKRQRDEGDADGQGPATMDLFQLCARLKVVEQSTSKLVADFREVKKQMQALVALGKNAEAKEKLTKRFTKELRDAMHKNEYQAIRTMPFMELVSGTEQLSWWFIFIEHMTGIEWTKEEQTALGNAMGLVRDTMRKERSDLVKRIRGEFVKRIESRETSLPPFPTKKDTKEDVMEWVAALDACHVPRATDLGEYLEMAVAVTLEVFKDAAKLRQLIFTLWIYRSWRQGENNIQKSAETPFRQFADFQKMLESEEEMKTRLTDELNAAIEATMVEIPSDGNNDNDDEGDHDDDDEDDHDDDNDDDNDSKGS